MEDFDLSAFFFTLCLWCVSTAGWAQTNDNDRKSIHLPDSVRHDYEEWLRNEPKRDIVHDSSKLQPLPPQLPYVPICGWPIRVIGSKNNAKSRRAVP